MLLLLQGPEDLVFAKYGKVLEVWHLADEGRIEEVIDEVNRLHPRFFEHSPQHLFRLKQVGGNNAFPH